MQKPSLVQRLRNRRNTLAAAGRGLEARAVDYCADLVRKSTCATNPEPPPPPPAAPADDVGASAGVRWLRVL